MEFLQQALGILLLTSLVLLLMAAGWGSALSIHAGKHDAGRANDTDRNDVADEALSFSPLGIPAPGKFASHVNCPFFA